MGRNSHCPSINESQKPFSKSVTQERWDRIFASKSAKRKPKQSKSK